MKQTSRGFTIVELLVVIVVIGILVSVTVVAFTGVQKRARDSQRLSDVAVIVKALELYKLAKGEYPPVLTGVPVYWGWNMSSAGAQYFLPQLVSEKIINKVPLDPINNLNETNDGYGYVYYTYAAGSRGCTPSKGDFYVLEITQAESVVDFPSSPGFKCPLRDWSNDYVAWVTGGFTNS